MRHALFNNFLLMEDFSLIISMSPAMFENHLLTGKISYSPIFQPIIDQDLKSAELYFTPHRTLKSVRVSITDASSGKIVAREVLSCSVWEKFLDYLGSVVYYLHDRQYKGQLSQVL